MSEALRTFPEYVERYADANHITYDEAKEHAMVKAFGLMKGGNEKLKKGDMVRASSTEELVNISTELESQGYTTDFLYEKDGVKGKWCVIVDCPK